MDLEQKGNSSPSLWFSIEAVSFLGQQQGSQSRILNRFRAWDTLLYMYTVYIILLL